MSSLHGNSPQSPFSGSWVGATLSPWSSSAIPQAATGAIGHKVGAFPQLERLRARLLAFHPTPVYSEVLGQRWGWEVAEGHPARGAGPRCQPGD